MEISLILSVWWVVYEAGQVDISHVNFLFVPYPVIIQ